MGARTFPPAMDRGAGRGPALGVARSSRRAPAVQRARCAPPQDLVRVGVVGPIWPKRDRLQVRYVARAKCEKCIGSCLSIPHSSVFNMLKVTFPVADTPR